ncbi:MAG: dihydroorotase [Firmicutes bacterium]|nr:dihydroorotase [Bacillota bacterium]
MLIKNGFVINPAAKTQGEYDIRITDGIISEIGELTAADGEEVIDAAGNIVAPGLIDTHIHFRDPGFTHKEDLHTGSLAAAKGGFTSVICMANTKPVVDSVETLTDILERAKAEDINIYQVGSVTYGLKGKEMTDFEALAAAGAAGFTDDGIPIMDATLCFRAMERAAALDLPISLHEEDPAFISQNGINHGIASKHYGIEGSPSIAEESMVARDCLLALKTGAHTVIQHISSGTSVALVRNAKAMGANIHAEATPHHFTLTDKAVIKHGSLAKMNPPLRTEKDRQEIIEGLKDGTIDLIATDHAPHTADEKAAEPMWAAPSGITGLETALSLAIKSLVEPGHMSMMQVLEKMTSNPATLYKLPGGDISEGKPADIVIFDPEEEWTVSEFASKSSNTPFTGEDLPGIVRYTICGGKIIYENK